MADKMGGVRDPRMDGQVNSPPHFLIDLRRGTARRFGSCC
jgi:hypothetical protein